MRNRTPLPNLDRSHVFAGKVVVMNDEVQMIVPAGMFGANEHDSALDKFLRLVGEKYQEDGGWGEKYGARVDNEVFMMHPFCWCDRESCPWCAGCECPDSAYHYFVDGVEVSSESYDAVFRMCGPLPHEKYEHGTPKYRQYDQEWSACIEQRNNRIDVKCDGVCDYCSGKGVFELYGGEAPNFWYKPLDFKVNWYKYIGRGVEKNKELTVAEFGRMWRDCLGEDEWPETLP